MTPATEGNMAPFRFPNPQLQPTVVHPDTGDLWIYNDGVWMITEEEAPSNYIDECNTCDDEDTVIDVDNGLISALQQEIQSLRNDIIELRAELLAASVNNFLILE